MEVDAKRLDCTAQNNDDLVPQLRFPPGFRYVPTDEELIEVYLKNKIEGHPVPLGIINDVNVLDYDPNELVEKYKPFGENRWYFFTVRERKYEHGIRPSRMTTTGSWRATGRAEKIYKTGEGDRKEQIGTKRILVFYVGQEKMDWTMHEYIMTIKSELHQYVLCTIQKKQHCKGKGDDNGEKHKKKRKGPSQAREAQRAPGSDEPGKPAGKRIKVPEVFQEEKTAASTLHTNLPSPQGYHENRPAFFASGPPILENVPVPSFQYPLVNCDMGQPANQMLCPPEQLSFTKLTSSSNEDHIQQFSVLDAGTSPHHDPRQEHMLSVDPLAYHWPIEDVNIYNNGYSTDHTFQNSSFDPYSHYSMTNQLNSTQQTVDPTSADGNLQNGAISGVGNSNTKHEVGPPISQDFDDGFWGDFMEKNHILIVPDLSQCFRDDDLQAG